MEKEGADLRRIKFKVKKREEGIPAIVLKAQRNEPDALENEIRGLTTVEGVDCLNE